MKYIPKYYDFKDAMENGAEKLGDQLTSFYSKPISISGPSSASGIPPSLSSIASTWANQIGSSLLSGPEQPGQPEQPTQTTSAASATRLPAEDGVGVRRVGGRDESISGVSRQAVLGGSRGRSAAPAHTFDLAPWLSTLPAAGTYGGLFASLAEQITATQAAAQEAARAFEDAVGRGVLFGPEERRTIETAIKTGAGLDNAMALIGARYTGPTSLDTTALASAAGDLQAYTQAPSDPYGLQAMIQTQYGGTPGEVRYEAQRLRMDPQYQAEARQWQRAALQALGLPAGAQQQAQAIVEARTAEEEALARLAREHTERLGEQLETEISKQLAAARAKEREIANLSAEFQATGDVGALEKLALLSDPEGTAAWTDWNTQREAILNDPRFRTIQDLPEMTRDESQPGSEYRWDDEWWEANQKLFKPKQWAAYKELAHERQKLLDALGPAPESVMAIVNQQKRYGEAEAKLAEIDAKYQDISSIPPMTMRVSSKGRADYGYIDEKGNVISVGKYLKKLGYKGKELDAMIARVTERQRELDQYFGDITDPRARKWRWEEYKAGEELPAHYKGALYEGEYRDIFPLYGSEGMDALTPPDARRFIDAVTSVQPSIHNVSTDEQKAQFNRIEELLGESERLLDADPWTAAQIVADVGRYLNEEERQLEAQGGELDEQRADWLRDVRKARNNYTSTAATVERALREGVGDFGHDVIRPLGIPLGIPGADVIQMASLASGAANPRELEPTTAAVQSGRAMQPYGEDFMRRVFGDWAYENLVPLSLAVGDPLLPGGVFQGAAVADAMAGRNRYSAEPTSAIFGALRR